MNHRESSQAHSGWRELSVCCAAAAAPAVEELMHAQGALAVSIDGSAGAALLEPAPGEHPLWERCRVTALLEEGRAPEALRDALIAGLGRVELTEWRFGALADRDWQAEVRERLRPLAFGARLWVCPEGHTVPTTDAVVLRMEPGLAFGSGSHPTTALCLEWLAERPLRDLTVLDYGCGSGILAIAALLLGARAVWAVDHDPQALCAARANARRNGVAQRIEVCEPGALPESLDVDVVVANILANPLLELAGRLAGMTRPGGWIVLSGIVDPPDPGLAEAYAPWFDAFEVMRREEWVRLAAPRRPLAG